MKAIVLTLALMLIGIFTGNNQPAGDYVVILHGIAKGPSSMKHMEGYLARRGFTVINDGYPSTDYPVQVLAETYLAKTLKECPPKSGRKVHFVTHSLGSVVLRYYLKGHVVENMGRVVMLAPPGSGSSAADFYMDVSLVRLFLGPALEQIGTGKKSIIPALGPLNVDTGVIAGTSTIDPFTSLIIPGEDDGRVSVEEARIDNMKDYITVSGSHTFIMDSAEVMEQTCHFLQNGSFKKITGEDKGNR
ncbi:MAG TPA: alpha/beta hydrolase [Spirochaetota bacterium]|mgnify:CR=1 FL=1|nr:alpha/beta hydrolase [Spirochaetota bacterium]HPI91109.1 alpha/beta hydrolase [Spirochaetota bacterium]HPR48684.1 alpha/beta hydrolase [Spirochaetota bacterium]